MYKGIVNELLSNTLTATYLAGEPGENDRVYPSVIPQKVPRGSRQIPCVVFDLRNVERQTTYCRTSRLVKSTYTLDSYSSDYDEAKALADAVRRALINYRGLLGGIVDVREATIDSEFDVHDFEPGLYRVSQTWSFWHVE